MDCPEYDVVPEAEERAKWRAAMAQRGYGAWPIGPIYGTAYDRNYPDTNWLNDVPGFLSRVDELIADGFEPIFHAIPDDEPARGPGGDAGIPNYEWLNRVLKPIYQSPEFQARFKRVVPAWEPRWWSATWVDAVVWTRECFPEADIDVHMQPGHSAPGDATEPEDKCMCAVAPYINGVRFQSGQFGEPDYKWMTDEDGRSFQSKMTRLQQFLREIWDIGRRVTFGVGDWPTKGYRGCQLKVKAAEYASGWVYHNNATEAEANEWGRALQETPPFENPDRPGEIIDLTPYRPLFVGDGGFVETV